MRPNRKKIVVGVALAVMVGAVFLLDLQQHLTFEAIRASRIQAREFYLQQPLTAIAGFMAVYMLMVPLNLPGAALLGLLAGAVFGMVSGTIMVSFASSIGATLACALSRYLLRDLVRANFPQVVATMDRGMAREGGFYLFSLRLIPAVPFFMINLVMGLTAIRLRTFYWISQIGMLPGTLVFVNAGSELGRLNAPGDIFSLRLLAALALLGLLPLLADKLLGLYRAHSGMPVAESSSGAELIPAFAAAPEETLRLQAEAVRSGCTGCKACAIQCAFIKRYGLPGEIGASVLAQRVFADPHACSLCNLCTAVCPEKLDPGALFLAMRRQAVAGNGFTPRPYRKILAYERWGGSPLFSWYGLPTGCHSVFFPGCALPGSRPTATWNLYRRLKADLPSLGMVLDCCHKPSHDLGRQAHFLARFRELADRLSERGVREILVACPSCQRVFMEYGSGLTVRSVWEALAEKIGNPVDPKSARFPVTVHDPCPLRGQPGVLRAVRRLIVSHGLEVREMRAAGKRTLCCGEGGSVGFRHPDLAGNWTAQRRQLAGNLPVFTYCAGCAGFLARGGMQVVHLADLLTAPEAALSGKRQAAGAPWTYLHRLRLKRWLQNDREDFAQPRVNPFTPEGASCKGGDRDTGTKP
jgi:uncharacterized membrane protein YdjX (TVP38/TMEM64 family)/ferredoxin